MGGVDLLAGAAGSGQTGVRAIYTTAREMGALHRGSPQPGDLVFFRETYDRNFDQRRNDGLTHIGIVERIREDGSVVFLHRANSGVRRSVMNLERSRVHRSASGAVINDYLRAAGPRTRAYVTGELFAGWGSAEKLAAAAASTSPTSKAHARHSRSKK